MQVKVVHATKENGNRKQETSIANILICTDCYKKRTVTNTYITTLVASVKLTTLPNGITEEYVHAMPSKEKACPPKDL